MNFDIANLQANKGMNSDWDFATLHPSRLCLTLCLNRRLIWIIAGSGIVYLIIILI